MSAVETVDAARAAYDRRAWLEAYEGLRAAEARQDLDPSDLERLAVAAYLIGHTDDAVSALERLHHVLLDAGDLPGAARWAVWIGMLLFQQGHPARGGGWVARAERLLDEASGDRPERGLLLVPAALQALGSRDAATACDLFEQVSAIAERFDDRDLAVMGLLGRGQAQVAMGQPGPGVVLLDDAMVAVTTGEVLPILSGIVYCAVIISCRDAFDLRRAQEWTAALSRWCSEQPDLVPFRGQCLVHRSEIMQLRGDWPEAMEEVEAACTHLSDPPGDPVMGMARYQQAELLRLRGRFTESEVAYREAGDRGHHLHPGLALLRLAQGRVDDAAGAIRRVVEEAEDDRVRFSRVLAAYVEIMLAVGDTTAAAWGVEELEAIAADFDSVHLESLATQGRGAVLLADGQPGPACVALRRAWRGWQDLDAPYEAARVRLLLARAYRRLEDHDTAAMELDAAWRVFQQLGAAPALEEAAAVGDAPGPGDTGGLTPREVEVLRLVATGATNREVADALVISQKTVARHLSNMFTKLGISSRSAATAWAYEHDVV